MTFEGIIEALKQVNGRRRTRVLTEHDIEWIISEAIRDDYSFASGGEVANAYKYPAVQTTAIAALRSDGDIAFAVGTSNAKKGSCPRPSDVPITRLRPDSDAIRADVRAWADNPVNGFVLPFREAMKTLTVTEASKWYSDAGYHC
jgi:hypothetical protein